MTYRRIVPVEFSHCDPAGIVFYPRYAEWANHVVENFLLDEVGYGFAQMMADKMGMPTVRLEIDYKMPSRLGDRLEWRLNIEHLGTSSARFLLAAEDRVTARVTVVWLGPDFRPAPWPDHIRSALQAHLLEAPA